MNEEFRDESILDNAGCNDNIMLSFMMRGNSEQSGSHGVRKLDKILEGKFDLIFFDYSEEMIPMLGILFLGDSFEFLGCFW